MCGNYMGLGIALGVAIGAGMGAATGHMAQWVGSGAAIGVAIGLLMNRTAKPRPEMKASNPKWSRAEIVAFPLARVQTPKVLST